MADPVALPTIDEILADAEKRANPDNKVVVKSETTSDDDPAPVDPGDPNPEPSVDDEVAALAAKVDPKPEPKKDVAAARFAALARREREARQLREEADNRVKAAEERERKLAEQDERRRAIKNPLDLLKEHGYSYADATQAVLGGYKPAEPDPVSTKLDEKLNPVAEQVKQLKQAQDEITQALQEIQKHRVEIAQREVRQAIEQTAKEGSYEFIANVGDEAYTLVQDVISEFYKKHKRILNYNEACDRVEKYYEDRFETLAKASKVQSRLVPATQIQAPAKPNPASVKPAKESKTLTQSLSTSARAKTDIDKLSKADALAQLAATLRYTHD